MEAEDGVWTCEMATFVSECVEDFNIGGYIYIIYWWVYLYYVHVWFETCGHLPSKVLTCAY